MQESDPSIIPQDKKWHFISLSIVHIVEELRSYCDYGYVQVCADMLAKKRFCLALSAGNIRVFDWCRDEVRAKF